MSRTGAAGAIRLAVLFLLAVEAGLAEAPAPRALNWMGHWLHEDLRERLVREVALDYSFRHPDLELNLRFPQEILGVRSKPLVAREIAAMLRSGELRWDVVWMDDQIYALVAEELGDPQWGRRHLVDFQEVPGFARTQKPFILADPAYRGQTGGILVGPYIEGYYYALWVNTAVAERMGLQIKMRGMGFEDLLGYVRQVEERNRRSGTRVAAFYEAKDWPTLEILFQALVKSEIPGFEEAKAETLTAAKRGALRRGLEAFEALGRSRPLIDSAADNLWFDTRHLVLEDQALFYVNGTWMYSHWRGIDERKLQKMRPAELPVWRPVGHALGGFVPTWAVLKDSPNRRAGIDLLMWWSRPSVAEKWVRYTKNPTGLVGNLSDPSFSDDPYAQYVAYMTEKYGANVHYASDAGYLLGRRNAELHFELKRQLERLLAGETTAARALEELERGLQP
jgi:hypothetical protein